MISSLKLPISLSLELKKKPEKTILNISDNDLINNKEKVLEILKKECVDVKSWFYIILFYYSIEDYKSFKLFSEELIKKSDELKNNSEQNFFKEQKPLFVHILNILTFFYSFISEKCKDKESYENYSVLSTSLINHAENIIFVDEMTLISKGFLQFIKNDFEQSDNIFSNISENSKNLPDKLVLLSKLGHALNAYNKSNYQKAIEFFVCLIKEFNYVNENILESLGICYYNNNQINKAKEIFNKILDYYPNNYKIRTYLSAIDLLDLDNPDKFENSFNKLLKSYELNKFSDLSIPSLLINICNILLISQKYDSAKKLCDKLNNQLEYSEIKYSQNQINKNISNDTSYYYSNNNNKEKVYRRDFSEIKSAICTVNAKYLLCINKKDEALIYFLRSVQENSKNIEAQFGLGQIYLSSSSYVEAEKCFEICKNIMDNNKITSFKVLKYLAFIYSKTKRKEIEKSIDLYKQAILLKDDDIDCYVELADLLNLTNPKESINYYQIAIKLIKEKNEKLYRINNTNNNQTNNDYALYDDACLYDDKIVPELLNNLACTLIRIDKLDDVEKYLNEAKKIIKTKLDEYKMNKEKNELVIRMDSLYLAIEFNFALYYEKKAKYEYTHSLCKKIISLNPYFIEAYIKLGELAKMRGNFSKANEYIKMAIEKNFIEDKKDNAKNVENNNNEGGENNQQEEDQKKNNNNININNEISTSKNNQHEESTNNNNNNINNQRNKMKKLISLINKPINPLILQAYLYYETDREQDAIQTLNTILKHYDGKDPYTLILLANIYYNIAIKNRDRKDTDKLNRAIELYFRALELDKYNSLAAIGLCNCLCEYNFVDKALDIYKSITEKFENDENAFINESIIYMNQGKYEKSSVILNKVLIKLCNNKNQNVENLLAKCYIETKEFSKANHLLKNLMMTYPDNLVYKFNYSTLLYSRSSEILSKTDRKVNETKEAIKCLEKSIKLFETISQMKKEEKFIKLRDFIYKCHEMDNICKVNLNMANDYLAKDIQKEQEMNQKNKLAMEQYQKMLIDAELIESKKNEINDEEIKERNEIIERNKEILEEISKRAPLIIPKNQKKSKKSKNNLEEEMMNEDEEGNIINKGKRKRKNKKNEEKEYNDNLNESDDDKGSFVQDDDYYEKRKSKKYHNNNDENNELNRKRKRSDDDNLDEEGDDGDYDFIDDGNEGGEEEEKHKKHHSHEHHHHNHEHHHKKLKKRKIQEDVDNNEEHSIFDNENYYNDNNNEIENGEVGNNNIINDDENHEENNDNMEKQ